MKRLCLSCLFLGTVIFLSAAGVLINRENTQFEVAHLNSCEYEVDITNQVAEVKVSETFINQSNVMFFPRFYFPMPSGSNATSLRWMYHGQWNEATIVGLPASPPGGPSSFPDEFILYMQLMPLIFDPSDSLNTGDSLRIELTYVQLLNYNFGSVTQNLKNDYSLIQSAPLIRQSLDINVYSEKQILDFDILGVNAQTTHSYHIAEGSYLAHNQAATANYRCVLHLSTTNLESWGLSTYLDTAPDGGHPGFFLFSLEEEHLPADSTFDIRLNILIDVSGSMSFEDRLVNAKAAACYVINNLQDNDMFNVILFDHLVRRLWTSLRANTLENRNIALNYINDYEMPSLNGTNLHGAVQAAVNQFLPPPEGVKNCILLLSDGQPTVGVIDPYQIINNINYQIAASNTDPYIFCFGVGSEVHYQLLSALAQHHHGVSIFLESSEIVNTISNFYDEMRNPIFTALELSVIPYNAVSEVFPDPFPAIYGGMQYRLVGRYNTPQPIEIAISGLHKGTSYTYDYDYQLQNVADSTYSFIPKVWASAKIDKLVIEYYSYPPNSPEAIALRQQIIDLSIAFGVVCVFTSFSPDPPVEVDDSAENIPAAIRLLPNHPNPFNPRTTIRFEVFDNLHEDAVLRIYNLKGQLVYIKRIRVSGKGLYEVEWDGIDMQGRPVGSGVYIYTLRCGKYILTSKMALQK